MRITGGVFRGRLIQAPPGLSTRPTQSRLRQALFNSIQALVPEARILDLFAGSGALGIEALSRGASEVVFVESGRAAARCIQSNVQLLKVEAQVKLLSEPLESAWSRLERLGPFDVVLADPPYAAGWELKLVNEEIWNRLLVPGGVLCLEWGPQKTQPKSKLEELPEQGPFLVKIREKNYGDSVLTTYARRDGAT